MVLFLKRVLSRRTCPILSTSTFKIPAILTQNDDNIPLGPLLLLLRKSAKANCPAVVVSKNVSGPAL